MKITMVASLIIGFASCAIATTNEDVQDSGSEKLKSHLQGSYDIAAMCFKSGEQSSGMHKICYYNCLGDTVAITISSVSLCPLSINN